MRDPCKFRIVYNKTDEKSASSTLSEKAFSHSCSSSRSLLSIEMSMRNETFINFLCFGRVDCYRISVSRAEKSGEALKVNSSQEIRLRPAASLQ